MELLIAGVIGGVLLALVVLPLIWTVVSAAVDKGLDWLIIPSQRTCSAPGRGQVAGEGREVRRIGLVGCTKSKLPHRSRAEELYSPSAMFRGRRAYVQQSCDRWFILSAEHGVLSPSDELEPYDETLVGKPLAVKREWSRRVLAELREVVKDLTGVTFEIHAGKDYWGYGLADSLRAAGATVDIPTEGMPQGMQLRFYRDYSRPS